MAEVRGDSRHTYHFIIFQIFPVLVKLNVTTHMGSNTLRLQSDLHCLTLLVRKRGQILFL
jgi:hypothetical protein